MKKVILACTLLAVVVSFGLRAMTRNSEKDEVLVRSLSTQEMKDAEATFKEFSEITSMQIVAIEGERFMKVEGVDQTQYAKSLIMASSSDCGDSRYLVLLLFTIRKLPVLF